MSRLTNASTIATVLSASAWTVGILLKVTSITYSGSVANFGDAVLCDTNGMWGVFASSNGGNKLYIYQNDGTAKSTSVPISLNTWLFLHATFDGTTVQIGVNGQNQSSFASGNISNTTGTLLDGYTFDTVNGKNYAGEKLLQFAIPRALSTQDIRYIKNELVTTFGLTLEPDATILAEDWKPYYPDFVHRPRFMPDRQQYYATSMYPERQSPLEWVDAPVRVDRRMMHVSQQQHVSAFAPRPETIIAHTSVQAPERVMRPSHHASQQQHVSALDPKPEAAIVHTSVQAPERVTRPMFAAASQQHTPTFDPNPERTLPATDVSYPDRINCPSTFWVLQQHSWIDPFPIPDVVVYTPVDLVK